MHPTSSMRIGPRAAARGYWRGVLAREATSAAPDVALSQGVLSHPALSHTRRVAIPRPVEECVVVAAWAATLALFVANRCGDDGGGPRRLAIWATAGGKSFPLLSTLAVDGTMLGGVVARYSHVCIHTCLPEPVLCLIEPLL